MDMQSTGTRVFICAFLLLSILGCGAKSGSVKTEQTAEVASEAVQEYAMIHQISDLETAKFYLTNPDYARENPYQPTPEDLAFFERKFFERVYPNFSRIAEKRGANRTRSTYMGFNPHDDSIGRSFRRKVVVQNKFKKTDQINDEFTTAQILYKKGRFNEAAEHMELAVQADPESPTLLYNLGIMYMKVENYLKAVENFEASIKQIKETSYTNINMAIHPKVYLGATINLGLVYTHLGMFEEAIEALKEAIEAEPEDVDANWNLGVAYWYMGDIEQTAAQMRKYVGLDPESAEAHNIIGLIYYSKELYLAALDSFLKAAELAPDEEQYSYNEGLTLARLDRHTEAMDAFKRASGMASAAEMHRIFAEQLAANKVRKLYNDGCAAMESFNSNHAIELFEAVLELEPDMVDAHVNLGDLYGKRGRRTKQIHHLKEAARLEPDMANVRYSLGLAYLDARMYSEAMAEFEQTIRLDPSISGAYFKQGMVLCKAQDYTAAAIKFQKSLELSPDWYEAHINLGTCYLKTGNNQGAIKQFSKAIELTPSSAEAHYYLGEAYIAVEDFDKTATLFQKTLEIDPDHKQARERLEELEAYQGK